MITKSIAEINKYVGSSVNPMTTPDQIYELYSVPSFESGSPEIVSGADIGSTKVVVEDGDILICKINPRINRVWVVHHNTEYPLLASSEWIVVRNATMNSDYLKWYFSSPIFHTLLTSQVTGIGGSLTRAQPKQVAKYPVPIPSRDEQDYVADILTCIDNLIRKYQQQIISIDQLVKSRFIELFGDPQRNPHGYKHTKLSDIATYYNGLTYKPENVAAEGTIVLRSSNIQNSQLDFADTVRVDCAIKERLMVQKNDILMCSRNGSAKLVGKVALIKDIQEPMSFGAFMMIIRSHYFGYLMTYFQMDAFRQQIKTGATTTINQITGRMLDDVTIPLPPMALVDQFAAFVEQTDKSKFYIVQMQILLRLLIRAIQQKQQRCYYDEF